MTIAPQVRQGVGRRASSPGPLAGGVAHSPRALSRELFCVGFAAESHHLLAHATAKRIRKGVPLLVGNIGPAAFGQDDNALLLVDAEGARELPRASKRVLAQQLMAEIATRLLSQRA